MCGLIYKDGHNVGLFSEGQCDIGSALLRKQYLDKAQRLWIFLFAPADGNNLTPSSTLSPKVANLIQSFNLISFRTDRLC